MDNQLQKKMLADQEFHDIELQDLRRAAQQEPDGSRKQSSEELCVICLEALSKEPTITVTCCNRQFHCACHIKWFQAKHTCPYCRAQFATRVARERRSSSEAVETGLRGVETGFVENLARNLTEEERNRRASLNCLAGCLLVNLGIVSSLLIYVLTR
jgi:hypothetical protein